MSRDPARILGARQRIKRSFREKRAGTLRAKTVAVVPAKNTYPDMEDVVLADLAGRPLIDWTLDAALACEQIDHVMVTTDDERVVAHASHYDERVFGVLRPAALSEVDRRLSEVLHDAVQRMESERDLHPDIVVMLSTHSPLRTSDDIVQAIDTLVLFDADSVISVYEDHDLHMVHGVAGLQPLNPGMEMRLRLEREGLYVHNGALVACWRDVVLPERYYGTKISHVEMPRERSIQIKSNFDRWMVERILERSEHSRPRAAAPAARVATRTATPRRAADPVPPAE
jgi:CMP-N-acetylneuraminic acid synthetase